MKLRTLQYVIPSIAASDGAGVRLRRSIGSRQGMYLDPFLMLDEFYSDDPRDYIAGFPEHPHRGFETVTYMLEGHMEHRDRLGNVGELGPGDVQWMTAARGIIHSEMPKQERGRMHGFQLWINLPAREKMKPAAYRDIPAAQVPAVTLSGGAELRLIAGVLELDGRRIEAPVQGGSTDPLYVDLRLPAGSCFEAPLPAAYASFVYLYQGEARVADAPASLPNRAAGVLGEGDAVRFTAGSTGARLLWLAARPLREPVVQYGPFVMNTREEIEQAIDDYRSGRFAA
jgi:redox-sensitive bicupin YhaK (pirin superfamily)